MSNPSRDKSATAPALIHVERAMGDLRRGLPIVILDGNNAILAFGAELVSNDSLAGFRAQISGTPALALTASRAAVVHIPAMTNDGTLVKLSGDMEAETIKALADPVQDLDHPMMGPFRSSDMTMGPLATAAIQLCKHAQLLPAALIGKIDSSNPADFAAARDLLTVTVTEIKDFTRQSALALVQTVGARVPLAGAEKSRIIAFRPENGGVEHLAIVIGEPNRHEPVLARIHSECFTGDLLGSMKCDCGEQLRGAIREIAAAGGGVLLYLAQEGRGIGLINKLRAYRLQDQGFDTVEANERLGFDADERLFLPAAEMLKSLGFDSVRLMTNNPDKVQGLETCGIRVSERVAHKFPANSHNEFYLLTKKKRSGHYL